MNCHYYISLIRPTVTINYEDSERVFALTRVLQVYQREIFVTCEETAWRPTFRKEKLFERAASETWSVGRFVAYCS